MEKYDPARRCPKCGGSDIETWYCWTFLDSPKCSRTCERGEHMERLCRRCGYQWPESCVAPEDVKPEPPTVTAQPTILPPCPRCGYPGNAAWPWPHYPEPWTYPQWPQITWITTSGK